MSTLATIVADFGDNLSPKTATVAGKIVAEIGTIVVSVDRLLHLIMHRIIGLTRHIHGGKWLRKKLGF